MIVGSFTLLFRWRPPQWERLYVDLTDLMERQLSAFQTSIAIIERNDPSAAQRATPLLTQQEVDARLTFIFETRPRQRTVADFMFLLYHFTATWYVYAKESGFINDELVNQLLQSTSTPRDVGDYIRHELEQSLVVSSPIPDDLSDMTSTAYQRALGPERLVPANP